MRVQFGVAMAPNNDLTRTVMRVAERQDGVVALAQLLALGMTRDQVKSWLRRGLLRPLFRGVYAVGHLALRERARWRAAVMTCGADALLAAESTLQLFGHAPATGPAHVIVPRALRGQRRLVVHRSRVEPHDHLRLDGIPTTTVERALVDLADRLPYRELRAVADQPRRLAHADLTRIAAGRRGQAKVARLVARDHAHTKSEMERLFARLEPLLTGETGRRNVFVAGCQVDVHYQAHRVAIELDSRAYHERRTEMREDRRRDRRVQAAGERLVRLMWDDLQPDERERTAAELAPLFA